MSHSSQTMATWSVKEVCPGLPERKPEPDARCLENPYNTRVLVHNWFEDRRQYHQDIPRCTGHSIYRSDFLPHHGEEYHKDRDMPPKIYEIESKAYGAGSRLLRNDYDYCDYMQNYMTTYDLMHNWEVRRAGCKPKPNRKWKMIFDSVWQPQPDNALPFGNLTKFGFRQSPQLPMVPNDWKTYQKDTTYRRHFPPKRYPNDYVLCRYASSKCNHQSTENMSLVPRPGVCDACRFEGKCDPCSCKCSCHLDGSPPRFPTLVPQHTLKSFLPQQNLLAQGMRGHEVMKRDPHSAAIPGYPILESTSPDPCCDNQEACAEVQEGIRYKQGPSLPIDSNVC